MSDQAWLEQRTHTYLTELSTVKQWPELKDLLNRTTNAGVRHWELPALTCQAVGGTELQAVPTTAALVALFLSIVLVDDMIDHDPKGYHIEHDCPTTSHLAGALQALGLEAIAQAHATESTKWLICNKLNSMFLSVSLGQYWDIHNPQDEESYWRIVETKSASFFGAAFYAGALIGGATQEIAAQLENVGAIYGEIIQLHDDLHDVMQRPANPDWTEGRSPLPILFASQVNHPEQERFLALRQQIHNPAILLEAQSILIRCGAVSYLIDQLLQRQQKADALLADIPLIKSSAIQSLLDRTTEPLHQLLNGV